MVYIYKTIPFAFEWSQLAAGREVLIDIHLKILLEKTVVLGNILSNVGIIFDNYIGDAYDPKLLNEGS